MNVLNSKSTLQVKSKQLAGSSFNISPKLYGAMHMQDSVIEPIDMNILLVQDFEGNSVLHHMVR